MFTSLLPKKFGDETYPGLSGYPVAGGLHETEFLAKPWMGTDQT